MIKKSGFTLMEIIVVVIIMGILIVIAIPGLINNSEQTRAQMAKSNLLAMGAAQQKYFEDHGYYCSNQAPNALCGSSPMSNLSLSGGADKFTYTCTNAAAPYQCTATDPTVTLTLTVTAQGVTVTCAGPVADCPQ